MKNLTSNDFQQGLTNTKRNSLNKQQKANFSSKAVKPVMTDQLIIPPAHIWNKIEAILDEQDNRRKNAIRLITSSFEVSRSKSGRLKIYLATVAGVSFFAGLIWFIK